MKVRNMLGRTGRPVANQFIITGVPAGIFNTDGIHIPSGDMFQSYDSNIAFRDFTGKVYLDATHWKISRTTSKYLNQFLDSSEGTVEDMINSGRYILTGLN